MTKPQRNKEILVLLHNIRSTHNVGSIFRTADALGVSKIYISGYTSAPVDRFGRPRRDIAKVALGAEKSISWESVTSPESLIRKLKKSGIRVISIEQSKNSVDYKKVKVKYPVLFVVGTEVSGIDKNILVLSDAVVEIPMGGKKESLNVSVAFGVALFRMLEV
ncbi:MAG TPA: TrmH family RNA methyltransferase [Candidatus Paceibacterota bacterium]